MFKTGDLVRHRTKDDWGLGKVVSLTADGKVVTTFAGRQGDVMLTKAAAESHLQLDESAEWQTPAPKRKAKVAKKVLCITCGRDLRQSFAYAAHGWKACPECSHKNGKQHVLRPYPAAFEAPERNGAIAHGDSTHAGWCLNCQAKEPVPEGAFKVCSDITR